MPRKIAIRNIVERLLPKDQWDVLRCQVSMARYLATYSEFDFNGMNGLGAKSVETIKDFVASNLFELSNVDRTSKGKRLRDMQNRREQVEAMGTDFVRCPTCHSKVRSSRLNKVN